MFSTVCYKYLHSESVQYLFTGWDAERVVTFSSGLSIYSKERKMSLSFISY